MRTSRKKIVEGVCGSAVVFSTRYGRAVRESGGDVVSEENYVKVNGTST